MIVSSGEFLFVKLCTHFNRSEIVSQKKITFLVSTQQHHTIFYYFAFEIK